MRKVELKIDSTFSMFMIFLRSDIQKFRNNKVC